MENNKDDDDDYDDDDDDNSSRSIWQIWFRVLPYPDLRSLSWRHLTVEYHFKDNVQGISAFCEHWAYDVIQIWQKQSWAILKLQTVWIELNGIWVRALPDTMHLSTNRLQTR